MAAMSQTTFSSAWMVTFNFEKKFTEICSLQSTWQYGSIGPDNGLAPNRRQTIICSNDGLGDWRIYASLGRNELNHRIGVMGVFKVSRIIKCCHNNDCEKTQCINSPSSYAFQKICELTYTYNHQSRHIYFIWHMKTINYQNE